MSTGNGQRPVDMTIEVLDGDTVHNVKFGDFNALDSRAFRVELDMSLMDAFLICMNGRQELDIVAGLVWLHLRRSEPRLQFAEVAQRFTYDRMNESVRKRAAGVKAGLTADADEGVAADPSS